MPAQESQERQEQGSVRRSVVLPVPVGAVWAALTDADHLSAWLGGDVDLDPFPGGQVIVRESNRLRRGVIVDLEPLHHLEIRWLPAAHRFGFVWGPDDEPAGSGGSVEFRLEPAGAAGGHDAVGGPTGVATRLTVVERPPAGRRSGRPSALAIG